MLLWRQNDNIQLHLIKRPFSKLALFKMAFNKITCLLGNLVRHNQVSQMKPFHPYCRELLIEVNRIALGINDCSVFGGKTSWMFWGNISNTGHSCDTPHLLVLAPPLSPSVESQIVGPILNPKEDASQEHSLSRLLSVWSKTNKQTRQFDLRTQTQ